MAAALDVDDLICRVLNVGTPGCALTQNVKEIELVQLCILAREVLLAQGSLVEIEPNVKICGDVHGQYSDVLRIFDKGGFPPTANYLFLGDYVDRGHQSLETIILFFCYKVRFPGNFFILRGNHECASINRVYGFYEECTRRYPAHGLRLWQAFQIRQIQRPVEPANPSLLCDLLWADPDPFAKGFKASQRGVSFVFGPDVMGEMLQALDIDLVARAHQVVQDGYEFFANRKLVTLFASPHYCGQFDNAAAIMNVDEKLVCSFQVLTPSYKVVKDRQRKCT
ncbi:unnamed protein product, partial [Mesorhabditis spiculigera]